MASSDDAQLTFKMFCKSRLSDWLTMLCRFWDGIYVLYDYTAPRKASQAVQKYLSTPIVGSEMNILRCPTA